MKQKKITGLTAHELYFTTILLNCMQYIYLIRVCRHFIRDLRRTRARTFTFKIGRREEEKTF